MIQSVVLWFDKTSGRSGGCHNYQNPIASGGWEFHNHQNPITSAILRCKIQSPANDLLQFSDHLSMILQKEFPAFPRLATYYLITGLSTRTNLTKSSPTRTASTPPDSWRVNNVWEPYSCRRCPYHFAATVRTRNRHFVHTEGVHIPVQDQEYDWINTQLATVIVHTDCQCITQSANA